MFELLPLITASKLSLCLATVGLTTRQAIKFSISGKIKRLEDIISYRNFKVMIPGIYHKTYSYDIFDGNKSGHITGNPRYKFYSSSNSDCATEVISYFEAYQRFKKMGVELPLTSSAQVLIHSGPVFKPIYTLKSSVNNNHYCSDDPEHLAFVYAKKLTPMARSFLVLGILLMIADKYVNPI